MIIRTIRFLTALALLALASFTLAGEPADQAVVDRLSAALKNPAMGLEVESVQTSEIPGLYAVQFAKGPLVYATADGKYFVSGDLYQVTNGNYVNLADERRNVERKAKLDALDESDMIVFAPKGETKAQITVFTDVTCHYCQLLHSHIKEFNDLGIKVRYLAFPRAGIGSPAYDMLVTAWCSKDPQDALTRLKKKEVLPQIKCDPNPVADEFELGQALGVRGTPALIMDDGRLIPGYKTPEQLAQLLGLK